MHQLIKVLWAEEAGFVLSAELILISTITVLAMVIGLADVAIGIHQDIQQTTTSFGAVHQSFRYQGLTQNPATQNSNGFTDLANFCDATDNVNGTNSSGNGTMNF